jgi:hypothetical protein
MRAGQFVGRVGGIAAALGVGMAIFGSTAVAVADTTGPDNRGSATASADSASAPTRGSRAATAVTSGAHATVMRARSRASAVVAPRVSTLPAPASNTVTLPVPAATLPTASAAVEPAPTYATTPPNPRATTDTPYGVLGQWMINKSGQVANWVDLPYCGKGSTKASCKPDNPDARIMQEPINTIFVVKAGSKYGAELKLDFALRAAGFGPSPFSSIGYKAILGNNTDPQMPHGGLLGLGFLPPLPFGLGQNGLLSLLGIPYGAAYRDAPFWGENSHLRTFGGEPDGNGNYIFTASVSEENLDATGGGLLPTHGFESYNVARAKLLTQMVERSWITGASNLGTIAMNNAISPDDLTYTTGDADGLAQVIAIGAVVGSSPARSINPARPYRPARSVTAV